VAGATVAADGRGVVDGVRIRVRRLEGDAAGHALARADGSGVVVGEGDGIFVVVDRIGQRGDRRAIGADGGEAAGGGDDIEARAVLAGVTDVEHDLPGDGALDVHVPD